MFNFIDLNNWNLYTDHTVLCLKQFDMLGEVPDQECNPPILEGGAPDQGRHAVVQLLHEDTVYELDRYPLPPHMLYVLPLGD